jgi:hypothetical protein
MLAIAVAAVAVYANSLGGTLLYDDVNAIRDNAYVVDGNIVGILTEPTWWANGRGRLWRPVTSLSFVLDHALHGLDPFGYHAVNVATHALVSVLVLLVFAATTGAAHGARRGAALRDAPDPHRGGRERRRTRRALRGRRLLARLVVLDRGRCGEGRAKVGGDGIGDNGDDMDGGGRRRLLPRHAGQGERRRVAGRAALCRRARAAR